MSPSDSEFATTLTDVEDSSFPLFHSGHSHFICPFFWHLKHFIVLLLDLDLMRFWVPTREALELSVGSQAHDSSGLKDLLIPAGLLSSHHRSTSILMHCCYLRNPPFDTWFVIWLSLILFLSYALLGPRTFILTVRAWYGDWSVSGSLFPSFVMRVVVLSISSVCVGWISTLEVGV